MTNVNQNLLLSRILTYLDGTLFNDSYYKIGNFIVAHYLEIENMDEAAFLEQGPFKRLELQQFMGAFGFDDYEEFIIAHAENLMEKLEILFENNNLKLKLPKGQNNRTKTY